MKRKSNILILLSLILFATVLLSPLFSPGFFPMHDDTQVARVHQMAKALTDGMFPVRWVPDLGYGYGYPIFNFYAPLAYYIGAIFVLLGFEPLIATKIMIALPIFIAGLGMYLLAKSFYGRAGGVIAAVLAMSAPYVALLIFVRGAIGEYYAYAFTPLVFYGLFGIYRTQKMRYVFTTAISFTGVVLSHNLTAVMLTPILLITFIAISVLSIKTKTTKVIRLVILATLLAGLLSAFYWLPALMETAYTNVRSQVGGGADFHDHFVCLPQLWESQWGFGGSVAGCVDGLSFRIGKLHLLLVALSFPLLFLIKQKRILAGILFGLSFFAFASFMTLTQSTVVWDTVKPFEYIQYPWRFLGIISLSAAFLGGAVVLYGNVLKFKENNLKVFKVICAILVSGIIFMLYLKLFEPQAILPKTSADYTDPDTIHFKTSKISDEYMPQDFLTPKNLAETTRERVVPMEGQSDEISVENLALQTRQLSFGIKSQTEQDVLVRIAYFPAWKISLNGNETKYIPTNSGLVVNLPAGDNILTAMYVSTPVEKLANLLSIVGVCLLLAGIILQIRTKTL